MEGAFREDLLYRLNVYPILLPPLRERSSDIPALTDHFLARIADMEDLPHRAISDEALNALVAYHWPGNIRQLQNTLFRAVILSESQILTPADFPHLVDGGTGILPPSSAPFTQAQPPASPATAPTNYGTGASLSMEDSTGHFHSLADMEKTIIAAALKRYDHKMAEVARRLGIGRSTLYRKVTEYGLDS